MEMAVIHWGKDVAISGANAHLSAHDSRRIIMHTSAAYSTLGTTLHMDAEEARALAAELVAAADAVDAITQQVAA